MTDSLEIDKIKDSKLHEALCKIDDDEGIIPDSVNEFCSKAADGPLQYCTSYKSTVLHLACNVKKYKLAGKLFDSLPRDNNLLNRLREKKNERGDTVLHELCTSNQGAELVDKMLSTVPELLLERNKAGETCVFRAIAGGRKIIFDILLKQVDNYYKTHSSFDPLEVFRRNDGTTILHMAILTGNYNMAYTIAKNYPDLHHRQAGEAAQGKWTALQYLACSPQAFKSSAPSIGIIRELLYKCVSIDEEGDKGQVGLIEKDKTRICKCCSSFPIIKEVKKMKEGHRDALKLSEVLVETDTSWMKTPEDTSSKDSSREEKKKNERHAENHEIKREEDYETQTLDGNGGPLLIAARKGSIESLKETLKEFHNAEYESDIIHSDEAPLLMAARRGCIDIVKETLRHYPQAVYHRNGYEENLLHVAIKTRNYEIFDYVNGDYAPYLREQRRALDKENNSILHMVGCRRKEHLDTKMKSPVLQLSEGLRLLQILKEMCPSYLQYHRNNDMMTADELFVKNNKELHTEAREWLKRTAGQSKEVIILVATVAFAAAYAIPGGTNQNTGHPIFLGQPLFLVFTITDALSLGFCLTSMLVFQSILTSSYQLKEFRRTIPHKLFLAFTLLILSVAMIMVAFAATMILMVNTNDRWTKIAIYVVPFFPISIFILSYIPLYINLAEDGIEDLVMEFIKFLPRPKKKYSHSCTTRPASNHSF